MHEDYWFIKAAIAAICVFALIFDFVTHSGYAAEIALVVAVLVLVLDARRDRMRDFWHSF